MTFTVSSNISGDTKVNYALGITDITEGASLTQDYVKIYLKKGNNVAAGFTENKGELLSKFKNKYVENAIDSHVLLTDVLSGSEVHTYTLKAWIDENYKLLSAVQSSKYEMLDVDACIKLALTTNLYDSYEDKEKEARGICSGTGDSLGRTFAEEIANSEEVYTEFIQVMLNQNIIKLRDNPVHENKMTSETVTFKIKLYGTSSSIDVKNKIIKIKI